MRGRFSVSFWALLPVSALLYLGKAEEIGAILLPALCHELGHVLMLWALGLRIRCVRAELRGLCIEYGGQSGALGHALAAAAGPFAGVLFALGASALGNRTDSRFLCLSAGVSLWLSVFNLLPALPLDGGRIVQALGEALLGRRRGYRLAEGLSLLTGALLLAGGLYLMLRGRGIALLAAAIWLLLFQEERGLVKQPEMI